jgi:hypothetical protein
MGFQVIERCITAGTETGLAALALEGLDILSFATLAIAYRGMDCFIGDTEVAAVWIGAGMSLSLDAFSAPTVAFALTPGLHIAFDGADGQLDA